MTSLLIKNIGRLMTGDVSPCPAGSGISEKEKRPLGLGVIENAAVRIRDKKIVWLGREKDLPAVTSHEEILDACAGVVMPGLIDCHTHLVHGGFRANEFNERSQGKTYQQIAAAGGGIMSTVNATRAASEDELFVSAEKRLKEAVGFGTTAVEIKTGYGLEPDAELKMARVIKRIQKSFDGFVAGTSLAAHIVPEEFKTKRGEYLKLVTEKMLPAARGEGLTAVDVFVDDGAFSCDEARIVANAAKGLLLKLHLHVDQFSDVGGAALAAELGALSADHLDKTSEKGMKAMAEAGVVGVLLPGASFFAGRGSYPDARKMIDMGMKVAIATDYNPGTNPCLNLFMAATIAITQMGLTCDEALIAVTKNAAKALGLDDAGVLAAGNRADLLMIDSPHEHFPLYRYGTNLVKTVIIDGKKYTDA